MNPNFCNCAECIVNGVKVEKPKLHDCRYIRDRNALIPEAEQIAKNFDGSVSLRRFAKAMDELARPLMKRRSRK